MLLCTFTTAEIWQRRIKESTYINSSTKKILFTFNNYLHLIVINYLRASSTGDSLISGEVSYTGWMLSTGFGSEFVSRCSDVCTRWLLNTCLPTANPSLASLAVATLRSADRGHLDFPRVRLASYGRRSFAYASPSNWNSLPAYLRDSSLSLSSPQNLSLLFLLG